MAVYIFLFIATAVFTAEFDFHEGNRIHKKVCYIILCALFIMLAGFRYKVGGDTIRYMDEYSSIIPLNHLKFKDLFGQQYMPLCYLLFSICKYINKSFYCLQFIHAAILNIILFRFVYRNTKYCFSAILVYLLWSYLEFNTEIIRESLAVCMVLLGYEYLKRGKWYVYLVFCFISLGFHVSGIISFIVPLLLRIKFNKTAVIFTILTTNLLYFLYLSAPQLLVYLDILGADSSQMLARYYQEDYDVQNWHAQALFFVKWILFLGIFYYYARRYKYPNIKNIEGLLLVVICLAFMSRYSYAFYRFINYLMPFVWIIVGTGYASTQFTPIGHNINKLLLVLSISAFSILCIYSDNIITGKEDLLKYFPYTSYFNEINVYRPEW